jgi:hypothetical protein
MINTTPEVSINSTCINLGEFQTEVSLRLVLSNRSRNKPGNKTRIRHCFYKDNLHLITRNIKKPDE